MSTLVGLSLCKDLANVPRHDARYDTLLNAIRERISRDVEDITGRQFATMERTEYHQSYQQVFGDPTPQWVFVDAPPIDTGQTLTLTWAAFDDHATNGQDLTLGED